MGGGGGYLFFLSYNSDPSTTANCSSVSYFWQKRGENTTFTQREAKGGSMPLHGSTKIWRTEGQNVKVFTLLEKQSYILGHFFQLHTGSSDIIIMGPYASTNTIHQHHKVSRRGIILWKFITCKSLWSFGPFSAHLAVRGVMLVRDREVCARPPSSMNPKSILGTLGVTMGPYPKHAMSSVHVDSDKHVDFKL